MFLSNNIMAEKIKLLILSIFLDNEISLALESAPPAGPSETLNSFRNPFKEESGLI